MIFSLLAVALCEGLHTDCTALHLDCIRPAQGSHMATITKLPSGKYRAQVRRQGVYRAQSFSRKIDAQGWAVEIERAIESGSSRGLMRPAAGMTLQDVIAAYTRKKRLEDHPQMSLLASLQIRRHAMGKGLDIKETHDAHVRLRPRIHPVTIDRRVSVALACRWL
jgi:hypothetical protein